MSDTFARRMEPLEPGEKLFALPRGGRLRRCFLWTVAVSVSFLFVFVSSDSITASRSSRVRVDFAFEHRLPFVPVLTLVYSSLYVMFGVVAFALKTKREIDAFGCLLVLLSFIAGIGFLIVPAEVAFVIPADKGRWATAFEWADRCNLTYNLLPSLHVAYGVSCAETVRQKQVLAAVWLHVWALAIAASAWLTYQHHLVDLVAGYLVALVLCAIWYRSKPIS